MASPPPSPPAAPAPWFTTSTPPAPRPSVGRWVVVAAAVAVIAILVIAALFLGGLVPSRQPAASGSTPSAVTFRQALALANRSAASYGSGPWQVGAAGGVDLNASESFNSTIVPLNSLSSGGASCPGQTVAGTPAQLSVPAYSGALSSGVAPSWILMMFGSGTVLVVWVNDGVATVLEVFSGGECSLLVGFLAGIPTSAVDTPSVASAALSDGGSAFILAHPGGTFAYLATSLSGPASWTVTYTTCPASGIPVVGATYYDFTAAVSWSTGAVVGVPAMGPIGNCSDLFSLNGVPGGGGLGQLPLATVLGLGTSAAPVPEGYAVDVTRAAAGLVISDLELTLENATTHAAESGVWEVELDAASGCGLAAGAFGASYYISPPIGACTGPTLGNGAVVAAGETIGVYSVSLPSSVAGLELVVSGTAGDTGNLTVPLA